MGGVFTIDLCARVGLCSQREGAGTAAFFISLMNKRSSMKVKGFKTLTLNEYQQSEKPSASVFTALLRTRLTYRKRPYT